MRKSKYEFKQIAESNTLEIYIYEEIKSDTYDWWTDQKIVSETSSNYFKEKLEEYKDVQTINIYINSFGGSVYEAYGIAAQLQRHKAHKNCYIDGFAASAASLIPMVCQNVEMPSNSMMMIHRIATGAWGNSDVLRKEADILDKMMEANLELYMNRFNQSKEVLKEMVDTETWLTAKECLEYGFCDKVIDSVDISDAKQIMQSYNKGLQQYACDRKMILQFVNTMQEVSKEVKKPIEEDNSIEKEILQQKEEKSKMSQFFDSFFD